MDCPELQWLVIRNTSSFVMKQRGAGKTFTKEPHNLKGVHTYRYNGLVHPKTIGIVPAQDNKGAVMVFKTKKYKNNPAKCYVKTTFKRGNRRTMDSVTNFIKSNNYRKDLKYAALRKASAVLKSQRPVLLKEKKKRKKHE